MDAQTLYSTADDLDAQAATERSQADDLVRLADDHERQAADARLQARDQEDMDAKSAAVQQDSESALRRAA